MAIEWIQDRYGSGERLSLGSMGCLHVYYDSGVSKSAEDKYEFNFLGQVSQKHYPNHDRAKLIALNTAEARLEKALEIVREARAAMAGRDGVQAGGQGQGSAGVGNQDGQSPDLRAPNADARSRQVVPELPKSPDRGHAPRRKGRGRSKG